ncbi:MAG: hypothetical protein KH050_12340 [Clostridiaceae bacterium]|nr:hypothetical protein [Clostridiaceae bacterium]
MVPCQKPEKEVSCMAYLFLMLGVSLLLPLLRLAFRLRLGLPLLFALGMLTMCHSWYQAHTALADGIFLALVGLAALSWAVTFLRWSAETVGYVLADRLAGAALARRVRQARAEGRSMVDTQGL